MKKIKTIIALMIAGIMMLAVLCACEQKLPASGGEANASFSDSSTDAAFGSEASGENGSSETEESSVEDSSSLNENYFQSSVML